MHVYKYLWRLAECSVVVFLYHLAVHMKDLVTVLKCMLHLHIFSISLSLEQSVYCGLL